MFFLPNRVVEPLKGVNGSVLGCVAVVLPKNNPLPVRVWFTGVDCANRLVLLDGVAVKLKRLIVIYVSKIS